MNGKKSLRIGKVVILLIISTLIIILLWPNISSILTDAEKIKEFILQFKIFAPIAYILIVALQIVIAPIPGQPIVFAGGYIFGVILGTLYSMIGVIIGSYPVFYLSRKYGKPFVEKMAGKKFKKYEKKIKEKGVFLLFLIYLLPLFPDDIVTYIAGLTKIKIKTLMIISFIGRFPGFLILSLAGAGISSNQTVIFIIIAFVSLIIYIERKYIEKLSHGIMKKFEWSKPL
ncbi:MAG: TVP38/TMEM64 family protein [Nanoarchaeota archaeon]|nr:TVP38/TMEM64 family protein [Nanoarchaeota archaeon]